MDVKIKAEETADEMVEPIEEVRPNYASEPLVTDEYTADPSVHVFNNKI